MKEIRRLPAPHKIILEVNLSSGLKYKYKNMFDDLKKMLVEREIDCPCCGKILKKGDIIIKDEYRNETLCGYCLQNYKEEILKEEGQDGIYLR